MTKTPIRVNDVTKLYDLKENQVHNMIRCYVPMELRPKKTPTVKGHLALEFKERDIEILEKILSYRNSMTCKQIKGILYNEYIIKGKPIEKIIIEKTTRQKANDLTFIEKVKFLLGIGE